MVMIGKLAHRNLWRNKRRTMISISSVMFGAFFCIFMISFMEGSMGYMVDSVVERETGHFQIMHEKYWDDRTVETFIMVDNEQLQQFAANPMVKYAIPRALTFSMAWNGTKTRPVSFNGIDPNKEKDISNLDARIEKGDYLLPDDKGIIVGQKLAESMSLQVGDTLTLIGQGYQGTSAAGLFAVRGIFRAFDPISDSRLIYTSLGNIQQFIGMENGVSGIAVVLNDKEDIEPVIAEFKKSSTGTNYAYLSWRELLKETASGMASDKEAISIFFYVLYIIVAFSMLSTVIMMTNERTKEFGVMMALGTKRGAIVWSMFLEMCFVGLIGVILASVVALPLVAYLHYNPLVVPVKEFADMIAEFGLENYLPFALDLKIFITQMIIVVVIAMMCTLYPLHKIRKMTIIDALKN